MGGVTQDRRRWLGIFPGMLPSLAHERLDSPTEVLNDAPGGTVHVIDR
jgi:hypothetical protein